jgi:hypothetical protein
MVFSSFRTMFFEDDDIFRIHDIESMVLTSIISGIDFVDGRWIQDCECIHLG